MQAGSRRPVHRERFMQAGLRGAVHRERAVTLAGGNPRPHCVYIKRYAKFGPKIGSKIINV